MAPRHLRVLMDADYAIEPESDPGSDRQAYLWEESLGLRTSSIHG